MWAKKHEKCIRCGTTKTRHRGKGLCVNCYSFVVGHQKHPERGYRDQWSYKYTKCISCGTTEEPHRGRGLCRICHNKLYDRKYIREYMREYIKDPEKYNKLKTSIREYQKTQKGKECLQRAHKNLLKNKPNYYRDYCRNYRADRKKKGICLRCNKPLGPLSTVYCNEHHFNKQAQLKEYRKVE